MVVAMSTWFNDNRSFLLALVCVVGSLALGFYRPGTESTVLATLPILMATYIGARSTEKIMSVKAAANDASADTAAVISKLIK